MSSNRARLVDEDGCQIKVVHLDRVEQAREDAIADHELDRLALTYKVLGDPNRLKIVMALRNVEMCVCDLAAFTSLSDSAVSHQLRRLKDLALVKSRRDGQIIYYSLDDEHVSKILNIGLEHINEKLFTIIISKPNSKAHGAWRMEHGAGHRAYRISIFQPYALCPMPYAEKPEVNLFWTLSSTYWQPPGIF